MWKDKKIKHEDITFGPEHLDDELLAKVLAYELTIKGYRKISNAYCLVSRIDKEDWLYVLAKERRCSRADFYKVDGSGVDDRHRDHYIRMYSKDRYVVHPLIYKQMQRYW